MLRGEYVKRIPRELIEKNLLICFEQQPLRHECTLACKHRKSFLLSVDWRLKVLQLFTRCDVVGSQPTCFFEFHDRFGKPLLAHKNHP